jgi:hypothetical protein
MKYVRIFIWLLCAVFFGYDFYQWGGIKDTPLVGNELMKDAPKESFIAVTYMVIGSKANGTVGQSRASVDYVARKFPDLIKAASEPEKLKTLDVDDFKAAQGSLGSIAYLGGPLLVVLSFLLRWMSQKQVKSLGGSK